MEREKPQVFFDGGCGLCRREIAHYRRLDVQARIDWIDIARDPERLIPFGLDRQACMARLHAIDSAGRLHTGAHGFALIWSHLPYYRWLARLVRLPGVLAVLDAAYGRFARWRYRRRETCAI